MAGVYKDLDMLLSESDVLSLHIPSEAGVILDASALSRMKSGAVLVNTSQAKLVDPDALYLALKNEKLSVAAFDNFYAEGEDAWKCPEARLFELGPEKFFVTPHAGWRTVEADRNMFQKAVDYIHNIAA